MTTKLAGRRWRLVLIVALVSVAIAATWWVLDRWFGSPLPAPIEEMADRGDRLIVWQEQPGKLLILTTGEGAEHFSFETEEYLPSDDPDVVPVYDSRGRVLGWMYVRPIPEQPSATNGLLPDHVQAQIEREEFPVEWDEQPGLTHFFRRDGSRSRVIETGVIDPYSRNSDELAIWLTQSAAEEYAKIQRQKYERARQMKVPDMESRS